MKYEHLSYVQDNKDIIYQVYGLIQPKGEVLVQISYVPLKFVKEEHLEM